ncbi:MAG: hypothetical protein IPP32_03830 [Bacteroidetes bacterium]|nr:hypothetical protein [Bacteroidota bacterium]
MKRLFLLFFLGIPCILSAQNYNSKRITRLYATPVQRTYYVKERYFKGNLYVEGQAVQKIYSNKNRIELKKGPWKWYYKNGQLKDSIFYSDMGLPSGIEIRYRKNGTISQLVDYGTSTNFKVKERNWLLTIPLDYTITYYFEKPNIPQRVEVFVNQKKSGKWQKFDKSGKLISEKNYVKGKLISPP